MEKTEQSRREFLKRSGTAAAVLAVAAGVVVGTTQTHARGADSGSGVAVGRSRKQEITYRKTEAWEALYATQL